MNHVGTKQIETARLILRKWEMEDAALSYSNWTHDPDVFEFTRISPHQNVENTKAFIESTLSIYDELDTYRWVIVLKENKNPIGTIGIGAVNEYDQVCGFGYTIGKTYWNKGYMTEALKAVIHFAFIEVGYNRMEAYHSIRNIPSGKVMKKAGMSYEGRAKQKYKSISGIFEDCDMYAIIKEDFLASGSLIEMSAFFNARAESYKEYHLSHISGGMESKNRIASFLPDHAKAIIDFGIGTGLELGEIFKRFPDLEVTGLDVAENMLKLLKESYPGKNIKLHLASYHDFDFGLDCYDAALSVMTLHHYTHQVKLALYKKIHACIRENGVYIECDYMLSEQQHEDAQAMEEFYFAEYKRLKDTQGLDDEVEYHYDTPCTVANQISLLSEAGFRKVTEVWRSEDNVILTAFK